VTREAFGVCVLDGPDGASGGADVGCVKDEREVDGDLMTGD